MLKARLDDETEKIKSEFTTLMFHLQRDLESVLPLETLVNFLILHDTHYERILENCDSFAKVFCTLKKLAVNFFNYNLLELLINTFGSDAIKEKLEGYIGCFRAFSQRLVIECPIDAFGEYEPSENNLVLVAGKDFDALTLDDLKKFELRINKILSNKLVMLQCVKRKSISLTFRVFEDKNFNITEEQRQALQKEGVISITYGYQHFYILQQWPVSGI